LAAILEQSLQNFKGDRKQIPTYSLPTFDIVVFANVLFGFVPISVLLKV
jgi:hypothetical protein